MRVAHVLVALSLVAATGAVAFTVPSVGRLIGIDDARAVGQQTLYVSGMDIGPGKKAILRLRNTSDHLSDVYSVHYTVRDPGAGVPISRPGAGLGATLRSGDTLELDLGLIVDTYRASLEVSGYSGPVQFVAFGTGGQFLEFGPDSVQVEALQSVKRANFKAAVEWIED